MSNNEEKEGSVPTQGSQDAAGGSETDADSVLATTKLNPEAPEFFPQQCSDSEERYLLPQLFSQLHNLFTMLEKNPAECIQTILGRVCIFAATCSSEFLSNKMATWILNNSYKHTYHDMAFNGARIVQIMAKSPMMQQDHPPLLRGFYLDRLNQDFEEVMAMRNRATIDQDRLYTMYELVVESYINIVPHTAKKVRLEGLASAIKDLTDLILYEQQDDKYQRVKRVTRMLKLVGPYMITHHTTYLRMIIEVMEYFICTCDKVAEEAVITMVENSIAAHTYSCDYPPVEEVRINSPDIIDPQAYVLDQEPIEMSGEVGCDDTFDKVQPDWELLDVDSYFVRDDGTVGVDPAMFADIDSPRPDTVEDDTVEDDTVEDPNWTSEMEESFEQFLKLQ